MITYTKRGVSKATTITYYRWTDKSVKRSLNNELYTDVLTFCRGES